MTSPSRLQRAFGVLVKLIVAGYLLAIVATIVVYKAAFVGALLDDPFFAAYGLAVSGYLVSRFVLSLPYRPPADAGLEPRVAIVMPAFNEQDAIARSLRSLLAVDYPAHKLEIVAVDDGSTDATLSELRVVETEAAGRVRVIVFPENQGKRAAMAAGIRATDAEIVAFVDSDSVLEPDALAKLVQAFADPRVGAVCGHADVLNVGATWLTKMQAVRYYVAFRVCKAAESIFGAVTCCSGCFSAYRRDAIMPRLEWWEDQHFLGRPSTFGDDRSLTNCVLRDWRVVYHAEAVAHTIVPDNFRQFMKQQTRWKRSWTRESVLVAGFIWRKHPLASLAVYVGMVLPLLAPISAVRAIAFHPLLAGHGAPFVYLVGVYSMALVYSLYYAVRRRDYGPLWLFGVAFVFFYLVFLIWQTYYAILTARSSSWGTRPSTAGQAA